MSERSNRLFEIIQILRGADRPVTAHALADILEVAKRTIYRDVAALQARGVPIEGAAGIGYAMRAGYDLPPLMFTPDEIEAIQVGLALLGRTRDVSLQSSAERVARKIAGVLPTGAGDPFRAPGLLVSPWNAIPATRVGYHLLREVIREEEKIRLCYADGNDAVSERVVRPLGLVYYVDSVLLGAWCELRDDFRHFRMDRILDCFRTGTFFKGGGRGLRSRWIATTTFFAAC